MHATARPWRPKGGEYLVYATLAYPASPVPKQKTGGGRVARRVKNAKKKKTKEKNSPLLMLRILRTDDVHISPLLPPYALTSITQLLDRTPHLHAARLYPSTHAQAIEAGDEVPDSIVRLL